MSEPQHSRMMLPRDGSSAKVLPWCQARELRTGTAQFSTVFPLGTGDHPTDCPASAQKPLVTLPPALSQSSTGWGWTSTALLGATSTKSGHPLFCFEPREASWLRQSRAISACQLLANICLFGNASPEDFTGICPGRKAHFTQRIRICFQVPICSWSRPPSSTDVDLSYWQMNLLSWEMLLVPGPARRRALPIQGSYSQGQHCSKTSASPCM